jgi:hypothetical protein
MSFVHSPKIVTDGLVLSLDAGNVKSYPGSGTVWTDKSGFNNNGTLTNGPTFNSDNGGSIVFDGSNDYVLINSGNTSINPTSAVTVASYFNISSYGGNYAPIIFKQNNYIGIFEQYVLSLVDAGVYFVVTGVDRVQKIAAITGDNKNKLIYVVGTCDTTTDELKIYLNGNLVQTTSFTSSFDIANTPINIGGSGVLAFRATYVGWANGKIYSAQVYNRALTAQEVLQNYNATKSRFGLI